MSELHALIRRSVIDRGLISAADREEVYRQARAAVLRELWSYEPPLPEAEIDARMGQFDRAIDALEGELSDALAASAEMAQPAALRATDGRGGVDIRGLRPRYRLRSGLFRAAGAAALRPARSRPQRGISGRCARFPPTRPGAAIRLPSAVRQSRRRCARPATTISSTSRIGRSSSIPTATRPGSAKRIPLPTPRRRITVISRAAGHGATTRRPPGRTVKSRSIRPSVTSRIVTMTTAPACPRLRVTRRATSHPRQPANGHGPRSWRIASAISTSPRGSAS